MTQLRWQIYLFGFETQRADIVEAAAVGPTPVVEQSDVPLRGIQSLPAVLQGTSIGINLDNKFAVDPRNDTFVVTVDNRNWINKNAK